MIALQVEGGDAYGSLGAPRGPLPEEVGERRPQTQEEKGVRSKLQSEQRPVWDEKFVSPRLMDDVQASVGARLGQRMSSPSMRRIKW